MIDASHMIPEGSMDTLIRRYLEEDIPSFDFGGAIVSTDVKEATLYQKQSGVIAGLCFFTRIFELLSCQIELMHKDGDYVSIKDTGKVVVAKVVGPAKNILVGERVSLNILTRASGIATLARRVTDLKQEHGFTGVVAGTRKTTPGFRLVEKYALLVGGCDTHRMDLSSMLMLKDNHIWSSGSITNAVLAGKKAAGFATKIEVECQNYNEAIEAIKAGADIIMLDNYNPLDSQSDAGRIKSEYPHILLEVSGGITPATLPMYFNANIDIISMGCLTQGYPAIDFSLKITQK